MSDTLHISLSCPIDDDYQAQLIVSWLRGKLTDHPTISMQALYTKEIHNPGDVHPPGHEDED